MRTTFILQLATSLCCMFFMLAIANGQPGCTNPIACNYDPLATINNGSCCTDCCVVIDVTAGIFPSEVSWDITCNGNVYASGGAPFNGTFCLDDPCCYTINMYDSFGDGWNGAVFTIDQYSTAGGLGVGLGNDSHTLASGSYASAAINNVCGSGNWGCTNPAACNFDAAAICDDGSCCLCANACCVGMQLTGGTFPSEVSWSLADCNGNIVAIGGAPHNQFICMQNNCCYTFTMNDSFGDGWNGAAAIFTNGCNGFQETHTLASGSTGQVTLNVCIGCIPPVNDFDANATPIFCGTTLTNETTACSYIDPDWGSCRPTTSGGVWYHIVGTGDLVDVNVPYASAQFDPIIHIFTGVSGAMTPLMVNDDEFYGSLSAKACFATIPGVNYYILVSAAWSGQGPCYGGTFTINLNCSIGCTIPVSNDECVIAQVLSPGIPTTGTTVCANADQLVNSLLCTNTVIAPPGAGFCPSAYGVWYFIPSGTTFTITYNMIDAVVEFGGLTCPLCTTGVVHYLPTGGGTFTAPLSGGPAYLLVYSIQCFGGGSFGFPLAPGGPGMPEEELLPGEFEITISEIIPGCTDPTACNYNALATEDDGTCTYNGCTDPNACNYSPIFSCDDGSCTYPGCNDPLACNYNSAAGCDDGSCIYCPPNNSPAVPVVVVTSSYPSCNAILGNLVNATDSPESPALGPDLWYSFTAITAGVTIPVTANVQDINITLFDVDTMVIAFVNDVPEIGDETLNYAGLTIGDTYFVSVGNCDVDLGVGPFEMCISYLPETECDYGPGPYNLCSSFKADYVAANAYKFYFTSQTTLNTYTKTVTGTTFLTMSTVPGLQWGDSYDVAISALWNLTDGDGNLEVLEITTQNVCEVIINPQPLAVLRPSDNCANHSPHLMGNTIAAQPFVCGVTNWKWEFIRTDIAELPIIHYRGAPNRFLKLSDVSGLTPGGTYSVHTAPVFIYGDGAYGAFDCLQLAGPAMMELDSNDHGASYATKKILQAQSEDLSNAIIFPNPNSGKSFTIAFEESSNENVSIEIFDSFGRKVFAKDYGNIESSELNILTDKELSDGVYTITIHSNHQTISRSMIVQR